MAKFCANCGNQVMDNAVVCPHCNTRLAAPAPQAPQGATGFDANTIKAKFNDLTKGIDPKIIKFGGIGIAAVVVLIIVISIIASSGGYKSAVENYVDFYLRCEYKNLEKLAPKDYWDYVEEEYDFNVKDKDEVADKYEDMFEERIEEIEDEFGSNYKIKYKILDDRKLSDKKLKAMKETLKDNYDIAKKDVTKAYKVELEVSIKGSEDEDEDEMDLWVVKIDGKWYPCSETGYLYGMGY